MSVQSIPTSFSKFFWGDNLNELNLKNHKKDIIQTILERGNKESLDWLFSLYGKQEIIQLLPNLKLSKKSANFWKIYLTD
jgi:hypothetical protein